MKRIITLALLLFIVGGATEVYSQSWGEKLAKKALEKAKSKTEKKVEEKVDKAVDKAFDKAEDATKGNKDKTTDVVNNADADGQAVAQDGGQQTKKSAEMSWNKFDFVSGDEVMFDDQLVGEKVGEFPSQWDLKKGYAEVMQIDGQNAIYLSKETLIVPFMKEKNYLPDVFTIEFDLYVPRGGEKTDHRVSNNSRYNINLNDANGKNVALISWYHSYGDEVKPNPVEWEWKSGGETNRGEQEYLFKYNDFNRVSISFNKRALKVYLNETRVVNIPRCDVPVNFSIHAYGGDKEYRFVKNVRIAKGAVPLYDRMMSDGKFITYGITFDVGKSVIKPESMGEINRIVQLLNENPTLKFSVEGHTDATGNATSNQTLSEARSKAIVDKLVEMGIAADRLTSVGKGQNNPIADNSTDEGRAKNRRVEFVKQ